MRVGWHCSTTFTFAEGRQSRIFSANRSLKFTKIPRGKMDSLILKTINYVIKWESYGMRKFAISSPRWSENIATSVFNHGDRRRSVTTFRLSRCWKNIQGSLIVSPQPLWMRWEEKSLAIDGTQTQIFRSIIDTTTLSLIYITC
jgi:hypothetical protein